MPARWSQIAISVQKKAVSVEFWIPARLLNGRERLESNYTRTTISIKDSLAQVFTLGNILPASAWFPVT